MDMRDRMWRREEGWFLREVRNWRMEWSSGDKVSTALDVAIGEGYCWVYYGTAAYGLARVSFGQ